MPEADPLPALTAVLFDVGGTLWPDGPGGSGGPADPLITAATARVAAVLGVDAHDALALVAALREDVDVGPGGAQDTIGQVTAVIRDLGWDDRGVDPDLVRRAMCIPAVDLLEPFTGARQVLAQARAMDLAIAVVSNAQWRDGDAYHQDFTDLGLASFVDAYVSSVDVGYRKPNEAMFRVALDALGGVPEATVMVGNSTVNDIAPARALGMRTVLVAIDEEPPTESTADAVCTSLAAVGEWLLSTGPPVAT